MNTDTRCTAVTTRGTDCRHKASDQGLCFLHASMSRVGKAPRRREPKVATHVPEAVRQLICDWICDRLKDCGAKPGRAPLADDYFQGYCLALGDMGEWMRTAAKANPTPATPAQGGAL